MSPIVSAPTQAPATHSASGAGARKTSGGDSFGEFLKGATEPTRPEAGEKRKPALKDAHREQRPHDTATASPSAPGAPTDDTAVRDAGAAQSVDATPASDAPPTATPAASVDSTALSAVIAGTGTGSAPTVLPTLGLVVAATPSAATAAQATPPASSAAPSMASAAVAPAVAASTVPTTPVPAAVPGDATSATSVNAAGDTSGTLDALAGRLQTTDNASSDTSSGGGSRQGAQDGDQAASTVSKPATSAPALVPAAAPAAVAAQTTPANATATAPSTPSIGAGAAASASSAGEPVSAPRVEQQPAQTVAAPAPAATVPTVAPAQPVAPASAPTAAGPAAAPANAAPDLPSQLSRPLFTLASAGRGDHVMTVHVTPETLGPVTVRAHVGAEGVRVELFAPTDGGRDALRSILPDLRRDLSSAGLSGSLDLSSQNQPSPNGEERPAWLAQSQQNVNGGRAQNAPRASVDPDQTQPRAHRPGEPVHTIDLVV